MLAETATTTGTETLTLKPRQLRESHLYLPGSSLKGLLRGHVEGIIGSNIHIVATLSNLSSATGHTPGLVTILISSSPTEEEHGFLERSLWGSWTKSIEALRESIESNISLLSYRRILIGGESSTQSDNPSWALEKLGALNPTAAERIKKLAGLKPGWDGYGGIAPTQEAIEMTAGLLLIIRGLTQGHLEEPFIAPLPDGGLELEWELDSGKELMLVIPPEGRNVRYLLDELASSGELIECEEGALPEDASLSELIRRLTQ